MSNKTFHLYYYLQSISNVTEQVDLNCVESKCGKCEKSTKCEKSGTLERPGMEQYLYECMARVQSANFTVKVNEIWVYKMKLRSELYWPNKSSAQMTTNERAAFLASLVKSK